MSQFGDPRETNQTFGISQAGEIAAIAQTPRDFEVLVATELDSL
jgi:hypothetical protein